MDFKFANKVGDSFTVTHSAEALQAMLKEFGIHAVYDFPDGTSNADTEYFENAEELIAEYPNVSRRAAEKFFAGEAEIYDIKLDDEECTVSLQYPIPEIGYE